MNQKKAFVIVFMLFAFFGTSCKAEPVEPTPNIAGTAAAMAETIVAVQLTKLAEAATSTPTPTPEPTLLPSPTLTFALPTQYPTQQPDTGADTGTCLLASMINETIPDDTVMEAGEQFEKTWDIKNIGTCTWTDQFSIVFHHAETLGAAQQTYFPGSVLPGESFTLRVPMVAPAVAGEHIGFWNLQSADGQAFGTRGSSVFWVKITVEDVIPPDSLFDIWIAISGGGVKADGETDNSIVAGDSKHNYSWQGFATFDLKNIPSNATVTAVYMLYEGHNMTGTPFSDLGCMGVYRYNYGNIDPGDFYTGTPGGALWSFCSTGDVSAGYARYGGDAAIREIQNSLGGQIQFRYQFNTDTSNDSEDDYVVLFPNLRVEYTVP